MTIYFVAQNAPFTTQASIMYIRIFILPIIAAVQSARVFGPARDSRPQPPVRPVQTSVFRSKPPAPATHTACKLSRGWVLTGCLVDQFMHTHTCCQHIRLTERKCMHGLVYGLDSCTHNSTFDALAQIRLTRQLKLFRANRTTCMCAVNARVVVLARCGI